jgi:hypothetical protein
MKINRFTAIAFVYFFINAVGLPFGLLYTILLTPVFYGYLVLHNRKLIATRMIACALPFIIVHQWNGVDQFTYWRSVLLFFTVYIFGYAFYTFLKTNNNLQLVYRKISVANFLLTLVAFVFLLTSYRFVFWGTWSMDFGGLHIAEWPRLRMFTYEPSYYSTLLLPIVAFVVIQFMLNQLKGNVMLKLGIVLIPLVASMSLGVIGGLGVSVFILVLVNLRRFLSSKKLLISFMAVVIGVGLIIVALGIFYPTNPLFVRLAAVFSGADGSANGRTFEALQLGYRIAELKSLWWGVGFGQLKILGDPIIKAFYQYPPDYGQVSIPSAVGETFALFGLVGLIVRFGIEIYLFVTTRVLANYYRTLLFVYIFIYQFTGSFTTNIAEYVIWILAFSQVFPAFDKEPSKADTVISPMQA